MVLTPSQRIIVAKEIAQRLKDENWALIDFTLGQFGLPVAPQWDVERAGYIVQMIQNGEPDDEVLVDLRIISASNSQG